MLRACLHIAVAISLLTASAAYAADPIRIGVSLGLTGRYAEMSAMQEKGYRLWQEQINAKGGLLGRKVEMLIVDDESNGQNAASIYRDLIVNRKVDLVFGPYSSQITGAVLPVTDQYRYPVLVGGASSDSLWEKGYRNVYGVYTSASRYTVGFLEMLVMTGMDDIAILAADDAFSTSIREGAEKWAGRLGLNLAFSRSFAKDTEDLDSLVRQAKGSGAAVLVVCGHYQESVQVRRACVRLKWTPRAYYASVGPVLQKYSDTLKADADGTFSSSQWEPHPDLAYPGSREFLHSFTETYDTPPSYHAATAFASGIILEKAVLRAGRIDRGKLAEVLATLDTMTPIGRYGVDGTGLQIRQFPVIIQWQRGQKEIVWPQDLRTAEPEFR